MSEQINLTIRDAVLASGGTFTGDEELLDLRFTTVVIDSRKAENGSLFVAIKGEKTDGYDYIPKAMENGAICCVSSREYDGFPCIVVEDPVRALQKIATFYRASMNITVVGITGSVGKTSTKEIVASVLEQKYKVTKTEGNFNNEIGLPLSILSIKPATEVAVIEMGMNHFGEMRLLSSIARPTMCIMTNIGISHIENLGSRENILKAKCEMFENMPPAARCIFNGDDDLLKTVDRPNHCYYGFESDNDVFIESYCEHGFEGTDFEVSLFGEHYSCHIDVPGRHTLFAAMAAMAAGSWLGLTHAQIADGISAAKTIAGRVNVIRTENYTLIDDCYNAAPQSVESGIDMLVKCDNARTVCILGDMAELGDEAPMMHRQIGEHAARCRVGLLIAIGELSKNTYVGCKAQGGNSMYFETKEDFLDEADGILKKNDVVLVKASHFMEFSKIVNTLKK